MMSRYHASNIEDAEEFNIFRLLNVAHYEVNTHSALLRELLDSKGSHAQGNIFFKNFLLLLAEKGIVSEEEAEHYTTKTFDDYSCIAEQSFDTGRFDIIISRLHGAFPFCVIIENKVYALDQDEQIERYWKELEEMYIPEAQKKILYLSPKGTRPSRESITPHSRKALEEKGVLHYISYKKDIAKFLEDTESSIKSEKVRCILNQYINIVKNL